MFGGFRVLIGRGLRELFFVVVEGLVVSGLVGLKVGMLLFVVLGW